MCLEDPSRTKKVGPAGLSDGHESVLFRLVSQARGVGGGHWGHWGHWGPWRPRGPLW